MTTRGLPAATDFNALELDGFASALVNAEQILRRECLEHIAVIHQAMHDRDPERCPMSVEARVRVINIVCSRSDFDHLVDYLKTAMNEPVREALCQVLSPPMQKVMDDLPGLAEWILARWTAGRVQRLNDMLENRTAKAPAVSRRAVRL
jgi:hypothetical protein